MRKPRNNGEAKTGLKTAIAEIVSKYETQRSEFEMLAQTLLANLTEFPPLKPLIHSAKYRTKAPDHLVDKLWRMFNAAEKANKSLVITPSNFYRKVEDLAGVRLLHLHTKQMADIHPLIVSLLNEHRYRLIGRPIAYTWDIENQAFFSGIGFKTRLRPSMYTSVHYIVMANRRTEMRCELQVRTLMEEVWGEVSHTINYPHETNILCCREQLRVLARSASACTRLVDSIFSSHLDHKKEKGV
ncbi:MAG: (p)ppGpp synthetase [Opitutae bacterium]|nr:(p)ppGpp synthetase [Opitutae bacterium]